MTPSGNKPYWDNAELPISSRSELTIVTMLIFTFALPAMNTVRVNPVKISEDTMTKMAASTFSPYKS